MLNGKLSKVFLFSKQKFEEANVEWESIGGFCTIASFSHGHPCILHWAGKTLNDCKLSQLKMDICQNSCENGPAREFSDKRFLLFRFMLQLLGSLFLTFMISSETYSIVKGTNWHVDMLVILLILIIIRSKSVSVWSECQKQLKSKSADQTLQPEPISINGFPNGRIQFAF